MMDASTASICFGGSSAIEAEELRKRRDELSRRAVELVADFHRLSVVGPSEENYEERGDFDEKVSIIAADIFGWQAEAKKFAETFDSETTRKKMTKRVINYVRKEHLRLSI